MRVGAATSGLARKPQLPPAAGRGVAVPPSTAPASTSATASASVPAEDGNPATAARSDGTQGIVAAPVVLKRAHTLRTSTGQKASCDEVRGTVIT